MLIKEEVEICPQGFFMQEINSPTSSKNVSICRVYVPSSEGACLPEVKVKKFGATF